ncbi:hypothetical protein [Pseudarthrobacter sp. BIM B-2242]|uniref:hypothetical protein n=1 Tax=Pseudarthrobacter sp. BIM B-2242 TaxID=2772401 RepID=UPI00168ACC05|nr:hypothetical protein [Pseudarthrobacter sp. BIM B-2242]QOD06138.1 hypothetical protein IDT60_21505 [Pseudarthrobacter sp. BIM B-2242]
MKKRNVSLNSYPCGSIVLEVTTTDVPDLVPVAIPAEPVAISFPGDRELAAA